MEFNGIYRGKYKATAELLHQLAVYANKKGEAWRIGEGTELMDAYDAAVEELMKNV